MSPMVTDLTSISGGALSIQPAQAGATSPLWRQSALNASNTSHGRPAPGRSLSGTRKSLASSTAPGGGASCPSAVGPRTATMAAAWLRARAASAPGSRCRVARNIGRLLRATSGWADLTVTPSKTRSDASSCRPGARAARSGSREDRTGDPQQVAHARCMEDVRLFTGANGAFLNRESRMKLNPRAARIGVLAVLAVLTMLTSPPRTEAAAGTCYFCSGMIDDCPFGQAGAHLCAFYCGGGEVLWCSLGCDTDEVTIWCG